MIINEERSACSLLVERAGRREHIVYDDIGCMLDAESDGLDGCTVLERYVRDYEHQTWISAERATYLRSDTKSLSTPMGSGIVAFADRARAEHAQTVHPGSLMDWAGTINDRHAWVERRHGTKVKPGD